MKIFVNQEVRRLFIAAGLFLLAALITRAGVGAAGS